jgi:hypothetical protein
MIKEGLPLTSRKIREIYKPTTPIERRIIPLVNKLSVTNVVHPWTIVVPRALRKTKKRILDTESASKAKPSMKIYLRGLMEVLVMPSTASLSFFDKL